MPITKCETRSTASKSIIEEVLEQVSKSDVKLASAIRANHMDLQDFIVLSMICDQPQMTLQEVGDPLGISRSSIIGCVERLEKIGLLRPADANRSRGPTDRFKPTANGRAITRRVFKYHETSPD